MTSTAHPELEGIGTYEYGWHDPDAAGAVDLTVERVVVRGTRSSEGSGTAGTGGAGGSGGGTRAGSGGRGADGATGGQGGAGDGHRFGAEANGRERRLLLLRTGALRPPPDG